MRSYRTDRFVGQNKFAKKITNQETYCDGVSVAEEGLDLFLVMNVPNSEHSVLTPRNEVFSIR